MNIGLKIGVLTLLVGQWLGCSHKTEIVKPPIRGTLSKVKEMGTLEKEYDKNFNSVLKFYSNKVNFVQRVKLKSSAATVVKGTVTFMVCNDRKCLPPKEIPFAVKVNEK